MKRKPVTKRTAIAKAKPDGLAPLIAEVRHLIQSARRGAVSVLNTLQVMTNYEIGRRIVEHEQEGEKRAAYGTALLKELSARLTEEFGQGFSERNLEYMRKFFLIWRSRVPEIEISQQPAAKLSTDLIFQQPTGKLGASEISQQATGELGTGEIQQQLAAKSTISVQPIRKSPFTLSWTHYVLLLTIKDPDERSFYEIEEVWTTNPLKFAKTGDVLVCVVGATVGKLNLAIDCAIGRSVATIRPSSVLHTKFLYYSLIPYTLRLRRNSRGSAQGVIGKAELNAVSLWVPSPAVQKRIVAKVDELMALCDRLAMQQQERDTRHAALARASLARFADAPTPANLNFLFHPSYAIPPADLRKSILTLAVQGRLVPQDPNDEPAEEFLSRLGLKSTVASLNGSEGEDDSLPPAWARVRFEDVALVAGGVTLGRRLGERKTVTLPYLRVANVKRGAIDLTVIKDVSIAEDEIERYALRENDLLMTEGGDWDKVGRAAIWRGEIPVCLHQNHVFRARMRSIELTPFWFERYFNSPVGRGYFESASKQTTNLASINMRQVRSCPLPLPPLAEQRRIVAKVEQLMALVDALETQLAASRATAANLLSALVAELTASANESPLRATLN